MPKAFDDCVKGGGRVRTISGPNKKFGLGKNEYVKVCFNKSGMHRGYKHTNERAGAVSKGKK